MNGRTQWASEDGSTPPDTREVVDVVLSDEDRAALAAGAMPPFTVAGWSVQVVVSDTAVVLLSGTSLTLPITLDEKNRILAGDTVVKTMPKDIGRVGAFRIS